MFSSIAVTAGTFSSVALPAGMFSSVPVTAGTFSSVPVTAEVVIYGAQKMFLLYTVQLKQAKHEESGH